MNTYQVCQEIVNNLKSGAPAPVTTFEKPKTIATSGRFISTVVDSDGDFKVTLTLRSSTEYGKVKNSCLREPSRTKYAIWASITVSRGTDSATEDFYMKSTRGEGSKSDETMAKSRSKVISMVRKSFGLEINDFDFSYR